MPSCGRFSILGKLRALARLALLTTSIAWDAEDHPLYTRKMATATTENRARKRKAIQEAAGSVKKARYVEGTCTDDRLTLPADDEHQYSASTAGPHLSDLDIADNSSSDSEDDDDQNSTIETPLTPFSPKTSPRFPSELKKHLCTYPDCSKAFNRPAKLSQHILSHTKSRPFVCPHQPCTKDFLRQSHLKHHIKSAHSNIRDHICDWEGCEKSFITATRLKRHHAAHEGREKYRCSVHGCGQTFRKHATLQKHVLTVHQGKRAYQCESKDEAGILCGQGFDTLGKLNAHEGRVHGGKRFWCSICPADAEMDALEKDAAGFSTYAELQDHIKRDHPPQCGICGLVCSSQRELKNHVEVRHDNPDVDERKSHLCPEPDCGRAFTKKGNLNVHIQSAHKAKKYICGLVELETLNRIEGWDGLNACAKALSTKGSLENHIRTAHMGMGKRRVKSRKTMTCGSARQQGDFDVNLMMLTGVGYEQHSGRLIACTVPKCDYRFSRSYDLQIHLMSRHGIPEQEAKGLGYGPDRNSDPQIWGHDDLDEIGSHDDDWFRDQLEIRRLIDGDDAGVQGRD